MPEQTQKPGGAGKRLGILIGYGAAVIASLLTFPAGIPWMVAFWQAVFCVCLLVGISPLWSVLTCAAILVARGTTPEPALFFLLLQLSVAIYVTLTRRSNPARRRSVASWIGIVGGWLGCILLAAAWNRSPRPSSQGSERGAIVCLGDSLTLNEERTGGYPEVLRTMVDRPVINLGQPGITTKEAFPKLEELNHLKPGIVVIELGGHDFLKGKPRAEAKRNLEQMITVAREAGVDVILFEIPRGFIHDPWWGLEREIARQQRVTLIPDSVIRSFVFYSPFAPPGMWTGGPYLSDDGLHPNQNGNRVMAKAVAGAIHSLGFNSQPVKTGTSFRD